MSTRLSKEEAARRDAFVVANWHSKTLKDIAHELKITEASVQAIQRRLNLPGKRSK